MKLREEWLAKKESEKAVVNEELQVERDQLQRELSAVKRKLELVEQNKGDDLLSHELAMEKLEVEIQTNKRRFEMTERKLREEIEEIKQANQTEIKRLKLEVEALTNENNNNLSFKPPPIDKDHLSQRVERLKSKLQLFRETGNYNEEDLIIVDLKRQIASLEKLILYG